MKADVWNEALETWRRMIPPVLDPSLMDPWQAARVSLGVQRAVLDTWRDSCQQAHDLGTKALDWSVDATECVAAASRDAAR